MEMAEPKLNGDAPVCSICIANYNGLDIIAECIESVLTQDCGFPIEIIVHDDASTDGSAEFIRDRFPQVRLIVSRENVGFCVSNNRMVSVAHGKYILLLNNDATLMPGALAALFDHAEELDTPAILSLPQYDAATGMQIDAGCFFDPFLNPIPNLDPEKFDVGMVIGACMWMPKNLWERLGGFPEWFGSLAEDLYLCCIARLWGFHIIALSTSGYFHRVGYSFGGGNVKDKRLLLSQKRRQLSERNKNIVMLLCYPAVMLIALFPIHIFFLLIEGSVLSILKREKNIFFHVYWNSLNALWDLRTRILEKRHYIQSARTASLKDFIKVYKWHPRKLSLLWKHGLPQ